MKALVLLLLLLVPAASAQENGFMNALEELFVPSRSLVDRYQAVSEYIQGKFPFSVAAALQSHTPGVGEGGDPAAISAPIAGWAIDMSYFAPISELIKTGMRVVFVVALTWWLVDRLTPQLRL